MESVRVQFAIAFGRHHDDVFFLADAHPIEALFQAGDELSLSLYELKRVTTLRAVYDLILIVKPQRIVKAHDQSIRYRQQIVVHVL